MKSVHRISIGASFACALAMGFTVVALADPKPKLFICHATGSDSNPFSAIAVPEDSGFEPHLDGSGNPLQGHEQDFLSATREGCDKKG